jgi:hypothetical protein
MALKVNNQQVSTSLGSVIVDGEPCRRILIDGSAVWAAAIDCYDYCTPVEYENEPPMYDGPRVAFSGTLLSGDVSTVTVKLSPIINMMAGHADHYKAEHWYIHIIIDGQPYEVQHDITDGNFSITQVVNESITVIGDFL